MGLVGLGWFGDYIRFGWDGLEIWLCLEIWLGFQIWLGMAGDLIQFMYLVGLWIVLDILLFSRFGWVLRFDWVGDLVRLEVWFISVGHFMG